MALTAKQIKDLNSAMVANSRANVGNLISGFTDAQTALAAQSLVRAKYTAIAGDATADLKDLVTGLTGINGWIVDIYRSNVKVGGDVVVTATGGTLRIADGSTYKITAGDVFNYIVW